MSAAIDTYQFRRTATDPAENAAAVSPDNDADLEYVTRGVYVGVTGSLAVTLINGDDVTFVGLAAGVVHPLRVKRIKATGTTATSIVAVW